LRYKPPYGAIDLISLGMALLARHRGLRTSRPILQRARRKNGARQRGLGDGADRHLLHHETFLGFGAATIVGRDFMPRTAATHERAVAGAGLGRRPFLRIHFLIAFATILAVVAGLTISASTSFAHDFWTNVIHHGTERKAGEEVACARHRLRGRRVAHDDCDSARPDGECGFLVALAFAVAASAKSAVIVFSLFWKRFTPGCGRGIGNRPAGSLALILVSPEHHDD